MRPELERKLQASIELLDKAEKVALGLNPVDGFYLGFSGGKDSVALLQVARLAGVKFKAVHNVTGIDAPSTIRFIRYWFPEVVFEHAKENYLELVQKKGLPRMNMRFCCERLKERIGAGNVVLTGVRHDESAKRAAYSQVEIWSRRKEHEGKDKARDIDAIIQNEHQCIKGKDRIMVYPLLDWTEEDVWDIIDEFDLPVNPCYRLFGRVGCMYCPYASPAQVERYEQMYPKYKERVMLAVKRWWAKSDEHMLPSPEAYYEWWKSRKPLAKFMAENL